MRAALRSGDCIINVEQLKLHKLFKKLPFSAVRAWLAARPNDYVVFGQFVLVLAAFRVRNARVTRSCGAMHCHKQRSGHARTGLCGVAIAHEESPLRWPPCAAPSRQTLRCTLSMANRGPPVWPRVPTDLTRLRQLCHCVPPHAMRYPVRRRKHNMEDLAWGPFPAPRPVPTPRPSGAGTSTQAASATR